MFELELQQSIKNIRLQEDRAKRVLRHPDPAPRLQATLELMWFFVKSVGDDHLVCREDLGGDNEGTKDIFVAKPYELRRSTYDNKTGIFNGEILAFSYSNGYTRIVSFPGGTQTEIIIPAYTHSITGSRGERILGLKMNTRLIVTPGSVVVDYQDLNLGARAFAVNS